MIVRASLLVVSLLAVFGSCRGEGHGSGSAPVDDPPPSDANPLASFERMIAGEWRQSDESGTAMIHRWSWGPGKRSLLIRTEGSAASGEPWRAIEVIYRHPLRRESRTFGMSPFRRTVSEGTIEFDGAAATGFAVVDQDAGRRRFAVRWSFDGPDEYRSSLLESVGVSDYEPLAEWRVVRVAGSTRSADSPADGITSPSARLRAFEPLLARRWRASIHGASGGAIEIETTFERIPLLELVHARVESVGPEDARSHVLDAYFFHHVGASELRCLALSERGEVYSGALTELLDGSIRIDLERAEVDRVVPLVAHFEFDAEGALRQRVWMLERGERRSTLETIHREVTARGR
jgi:hypothetical protein